VELPTEVPGNGPVGHRPEAGPPPVRFSRQTGAPFACRVFRVSTCTSTLHLPLQAGASTKHLLRRWYSSEPPLAFGSGHTSRSLVFPAACGRSRGMRQRMCTSAVCRVHTQASIFWGSNRGGVPSWRCELSEPSATPPVVGPDAAAPTGPCTTRGGCRDKQRRRWESCGSVVRAGMKMGRRWWSRRCLENGRWG
jgi:hypothetical protein